MTVIADSDVLIEVLRQRDGAILAKWAELGASDDELAYSPVSQAEIWQGARPREHMSIFELFDALSSIPIDADIGRSAGDLLRTYSRSHGIGLGNSLIAATAIRSGAALWTRNRKHYPIPALTFY